MAEWLEVQNDLVRSEIARRELLDVEPFASIYDRALFGNSEQADVDQILGLADGTYRVPLAGAIDDESTEVLFSVDEKAEWLHVRVLVRGLSTADVLGAAASIVSYGVGGRVLVGDRLYVRTSIHLPSLADAGDVYSHMIAAAYSTWRLHPEALAGTSTSSERNPVEPTPEDIEWAKRSAEIDDLLNGLLPGD